MSETDKLPRNVLQIVTDGCVIIIRPSGTEPKLKFYCQLLPQDAKTTLSGMALLHDIRTKAEAIARQVYNDLLSRLDCHLSEASLFLSDIIDLNQKQLFDQHTIPQLQQALLSGSLTNLEETLAWLREEAAGMIPGADPLPALKAPLRMLCDQWQHDAPSHSSLSELQCWALQENV